MSVLRAIAVFLCGFLSLKLCTSQVVLSGSCPDVDAMEHFNATRYLGRWYEAEKYFAAFELGGRCIMADYGLKDDVLSVKNTQINNFTNHVNSIDGYALPKKSENFEAKFSVYFHKLPVKVAAPYWVVDTDYDSYSVVWSCSEFGKVFHTLNAWILTRQRHPPSSVIEKAYEVIKENNIEKSYFSKTNQTNCTLVENQ